MKAHKNKCEPLPVYWYFTCLGVKKYLEPLRVFCLIIFYLSEGITRIHFINNVP
jgi:hypothetical protein